MSERNLHAKAFDEGTEDKLNIYRCYLRKWLPVFMHTKAPINKVQIFDFFAGPGCDLKGKPGSPIIALEEIHGALEMCAQLGRTPPKIELYCNEFSPTKHRQLIQCIARHEYAHEVGVVLGQKDFPDAFAECYPLMKERGVANLLFLDQNGVKQVTRGIFQTMVSLPQTDFLFYIASSIINRFKEDPAIINPLPLTADDLDRMNGTNVHGIIKEAYQRLSPQSYLVPFSFKKGANVYGLIFGTEHQLGAEKFLSVCWGLDKVCGLANFDIENEHINPCAPSLFEELDKPKKLNVFEQRLSKGILGGHLKTNYDIYEFALREGFLPHHTQAALTAMGELQAR